MYDSYLIFWITCSFGISRPSSSSRTHLNPSTCPFTMQSCHYRKTSKEAFLFLALPMTWHGTGHLPLSKVWSAIIKLSWNSSLSRISNTPDKKYKKFQQNGRGIGWECGSVPTLSKSKMAGQLIWYNNNIASSQCKALFGLFSLQRQ